MPIIRVQKHASPYVIIEKTGLDDARLSFRARGILAYLLSKPDRWTINAEHLSSQSPLEGRDAIRSALKELETYGYAKKQLARGEDGKVRGWETTIFEHPMAQESDEAGVGISEDIAVQPTTDEPKSVLPTLVEPKSDEPKSVLPNSANPPLVINDLSKELGKVRNEKNTHTPQTPQGELCAPETPAYSATFETFWRLYPSKTAKGLTWRSWQKQQLASKADVIMTDIQNRLAHDEKWKRGVIPNPSTYLNQRRWEDQWQTQQPEPSPKRRLVY